MSNIQLPDMRYNQGSTDGILDQQQTDQATHAMLEKDVMRLLPPTWKTSKDTTNGLASGFYSGTDFGQSFDGFRVRPHIPNFQQTDLHAPQMQPNNNNHHHQQINYPSLFYNNNTNNNAMNNLYYPTPTPPQQQQQSSSSPQHQREALLTEVLKSRPMRKRRRPPHSYASLIAQAILTSQDQKMTLREIYEWVQTRYPHLYEANETGWQNTIRHNLSLNRCFRKVPRTQDNGKKGTKGGYWTVDVDQLNNTNFGRQILDSGFLGSIEYWHHEQQQQQLRHVMAPSSSTSSLSNLSSSSSSSSIQQQSQPQRINQTVEEIDFNSLMPFYSTQQVQQQQRHYTTDGLDSQRQNGFFTTSTNTNNTNDNNKMKRSFDSTNTNSSMGSTSSKTSSVRGSTSPNSPETDMSTPTFQSLTFQRQQPNGSQVVHHTNKLDMDPLLNPSLMRVNNILN